jgi:hypothetical protein
LEKSSGVPAFTQIGRPNLRFRFFRPPFCQTGAEPHTARGITGTPLAIARRPMPVFPRIGEKSGLVVTVDSG